MKRLLATGVTGFVGAHCLHEILNSGYDEVHAVGLSGRHPATRGVIWHKADLRVVAEAERLIETVRPTHLFHAAWIATPGVYLTSPENVNWLRAGIALVDAFARQGGRRVVAVGTSAEYGPTDEPCEEDRTPIQPSSIYGHCKVAMWHAISAIAEAHRLEAAWGRIFLPYGPGDLPSRLIPSALAAMRAGKPLPLSTGEQKRDFVYSPDAGKLLTGLLNSGGTGAFNIGSGEARSVRSVIEALADRLGARDLLRFGALPARAWEPALLVADMKKLDALGVKARTPMAEALDRIVASSADNGGGESA